MGIPYFYDSVSFVGLQHSAILRQRLYLAYADGAGRIHSCVQQPVNFRVCFAVNAFAIITLKADVWKLFKKFLFLL